MKGGRRANCNFVLWKIAPEKLFLFFEQSRITMLLVTQIYKRLLHFISSNISLENKEKFGRSQSVVKILQVVSSNCQEALMKPLKKKCFFCDKLLK